MKLLHVTLFIIGYKCPTNYQSPTPCSGSFTEQYSLPGQTTCLTCPAGFQCTTPTSTPTQCTTGYYALLGDKLCKQCTAGYKCPTTTDSPIACDGTLAEQYSAAGSTSCSTCAAGFQCPTAAATPTACANGYYSKLGDKICTMCPAGYRCPTKTGDPIICTGTGFEQYALAGSMSCSQCPAGYACPDIYSNPTTCATGSYSLAGELTCTQCPAGSKCPTTTASPIACTGTGTEQYSLAGATVCIQCPAGSQCLVTNLAPVACTSGYYSLLGEALCKICPAGSKCPTTSTITACSGTGLEQYSIAGATSCSQCPAGKACPSTSAAPTDCTAGYYSLLGDGVCKICPAGYKCPTTSAAPIICSGTAGEQYSIAGQTVCNSCPAGYACPTVTGTPVACTTGYYALQGDQICTICPAGSKCPTTTASPIACSGTGLEQYSPSGSTTCSQCAAGYKCTGVSVAPVACTSGQYALAGDAVCTTCPAGSRCPSTTVLPVDCTGTGLEQYSAAGATTCSKCPAGYFCLTKSDAPVACSTGYFSLLGDAVCTQCPAGYKCPTTIAKTACTGTGTEHYSLAGATACIQCPAGFSCLTTSVAPVACGAGYYALLGGKTCTICPAGYQCPSTTVSPVVCSGTGTEQYSLTGQTACAQCPAGFACPTPSTTPTSCGSGYYSLLGELTCTLCPAGYKCSSKLVAPVACSSTLPSEYSSTGQTSCSLCPAGKSCASAAATPVLCGTGYYSLLGGGVCILCPIGYSCSDPAQSPQACQPGTYTVAGATGSCLLCPAGFKCPSIDVEPIECSGTGSEQYSYLGSTACSICPAGYECPSISVSPIVCQKGYYSLEGDSKCTRCPAGYSCSSRIVSPVECTAGSYSREGATYCSICPLGYSCPTKTQSPIACSTGTYAPLGSATCTTCPIGSFCPSTKALLPSPCPSGFYQPQANQVSCKACPAGYTCSDPTLEPVPCTEGTYSLGYASTCITCPAGYYCPWVNKEPLICPKGKYSLAEQSECSECADGFACLQMNTENQVGCTVGQYRVKDGRTTVCRDCPTGYYCPLTDQPPIACKPGYTTVFNQITCTECPAGSYCPTLGSTPIVCPLGSFQPLSGKTYCESCPQGYYCPSAIDSTPLECAPGTYSSVGNLTMCFSCPEGFMCASPATRVPVLCPLGTYSSTNSTQCTLCEGGNACPDTRLSKKVICDDTLGFFSHEGSTHCLYCPAGVSCTKALVDDGIIKAGEMVTVKCLPGQISDEGDVLCIPCPVGFSCTSRDSQGNHPCSPGFYSLDGESQCKPCPAGFMCPNTDGTGILECLDGQFSAKGSVSCVSCPKGFSCPIKFKQIMERCAPGTYSLGNAMTCSECPEHFQCPHRDQILPLVDGYFSPQGTGVALKCRAGWECNQQNGVAPYVRPCELGYYSATGSANCIICPIGYYCPLQDHQPLICPEGYYNPSLGQVKCTLLCPRGQYRISSGVITCTASYEGQRYLYPWTFPQDCTAGTYSNNAIVADTNYMGCQKCQAGYLCGASERTSISNGLYTCPVGFWCNQVDERNSLFGQWACPAGFYALTGLAAGAAITRDTACGVCPAGYFCEGANRGSFECIPGYYCPAQTESATQYPCPAGTYQSLYAQTSKAACTTCTVGSYCPEGTAYPILCLPGYKCATTGLKDYQEVPCPGGTYQYQKGQDACITCPVGSFCPVGSVYPQFCPPGTYGGASGLQFQTQCLQCPANYICSIFGLYNGHPVAITSQERGFLAPLSTKYAQELPCPPGTIDSAGNLVNVEGCATCPEGYACAPGTSTDTSLINKVRCEPGYYCPAGTMHDKQYPCTGGTYSASTTLTASSQCTACPAGYFCPPGTYKPFICPNGYYCPLNTENYEHLPCPAGTYSKTRGLTASSECLVCPQGYFCQQYQVVFAEKCPVGSYGATTSIQAPDNSVYSVTCTQCPGGSYCPFEGMTASMACPQGSYSPAGSSQCFECQEGYDCSTSKKTGALTLAEYRTPSACPAGYFCLGSIRTPCSAGYYCPASSLRQVPCPVGTYSITTGNSLDTSCLNVPAGYFTDISGSSSYSKNLCYYGHSCDIGSHQQLMYRCPKGTYQDTRGASACKTCPEGFYCTETEILPVLCPQGHYCPAGTGTPLKCPRSTYGSKLGLKASTDCQKCSAGAYCTQVGQTSPDGLCDPGYYCIGGATVPNPTDGTTGGVCSIGGFCEYGSKKVQSCPPGTYNPNSNGKTQRDCIACRAGSYCSGGALGDVTGSCKAGYYCPLMSTVDTQMPAPPGTYTAAGASTPTSCAKKTYNPFTAQAACLPCKAGFYCDQEGMTDNIVDCPPGYYCPISSDAPIKCDIGTFMNEYNAKAATDCKSCLPGKFCDSQGLIEPSGDCEQGYYCTSASSSSNPAVEVAVTGKKFGPCPTGYYCPVASAYPLPCPPGTYLNFARANSIDQCLPCDAGFYCATAGLSATSGACDAGFYCPLGSTSARPEGKYCQAGEMCPVDVTVPAVPVGSSSPLKCPAGTYQTMAYQSACITCPAGYYCLDGAIQYKLSICPAGYICPAGTKFDKENPCKQGQYQPYAGQQECVPCDPGKYCGSTGLSAPSGNCDAKYYCLGGSTSKAPTIASQGALCPKGYYCPIGTPFAKDCPPGYYCSTVGLEIAVGKCSPGYYCQSRATKQKPSDLSADGGSMCGPGYYCPEGASAPLPCPPGTSLSTYGSSLITECVICKEGRYCEGSGLAQPTGNCAPGFYCPSGSKSSKQIICPIGNKCPAGSASPTPCVGTYQDMEGQSTCKVCPAGYQCTDQTIALCGVNFYCPYNELLKKPCAAGTFTRLYNASVALDCQQCLPGRYCPSDSTLGTLMIKCPAGVICFSGASSISGNAICPIGYYCPEGTSKAIPCPPGKYCATTGLTTPTGDCAATYYCLKASKTATPTDNIQGNLCPRGFYCAAGTFSPVACPIGTYNPSDGKSLITDCINCPQGYLCNKRGLTNFNGVCPAGYYCENPQRTDIQVGCPAGSFCKEGSLLPTKCPSGTYQPYMYKSSCDDCPVGYMCPQTDTTFAIVCPAGQYCEGKTVTPKKCPISTYNAFPGGKTLSDCITCQEGHYCATEGLAAPTGKCAAGYFCKSGAISATPNQGDKAGSCLTGYYCPEGSPVQKKCPVGTYSDTPQLGSVDQCKTCPSTAYCNQKAKLADFANTICGDGLLCTSGAKAMYPSLSEGGQLCPAGNYCKRGIQYQCAIGTYQPNLGQSDCLGCPAGKFCDTVELIAPLECPAGSYCPAIDRTNVQLLSLPCPAGTYSPFEGLQKEADCLPCKEGYYCLEGSIQPTSKCLSTYYCSIGSTSQTPNGGVYQLGSIMTGGICPAGYTCPTGTPAPIPCELGTYQPNTGDPACKPCPAGKYCDELGIDTETIVLKDCKEGYFCIEGATTPSPTDGISGMICAKGHFCRGGTVEMIPCQDGTFEPREGSKQCQACIAGFYCPTGSIEPIPCPTGYFCPQSSIVPQLCPNGRYGHTTKLKSEEQCAYCPAGKYCQGGLVSGECEPGFYCDYGATSPMDITKLCPEGHYCQKGTLYPSICPTGTTTQSKGAKTRNECIDCAEGFYCLEYSSTQYACPKGFYCLTQKLPVPCPQFTYNNDRGRHNSSACQACPSGYFCNATGIASYASYKCPQGHYCPNSTISYPVKCPAGTYNSFQAMETQDQCLPCPVGQYCPSASIYPKPCKNGTYCPQNSTAPKSCEQGKYCPSEIGGQLGCKASFYCPSFGSDQYLKCRNGTYCPVNSTSEKVCPSGSFGSSNQSNGFYLDSCTTCDPGTYSLAGMNDCKPCSIGYVCLGNTTSAAPVNEKTENGYICPKGYYCPIGSMNPKACAKGTYGPKTGLSESSQCISCPTGTYGDSIGLTECKKCGGASKAQPGAESCVCIGLNRIYLRDTLSCVCRPAYETSDGSDANKDSDVDCQEKIYDRCTEGLEQDQYGKCRARDSCTKECDGGTGTIQSGLGICQCDNAQNTDDICDEKCRKNTKKVSFTSDGKVSVYDPVLKTTTIASSLPGTMGELKCSQADQTQCTLTSVGKDLLTGDFTAQYKVPSSIAGSSRRLLESERRHLQATGQTTSIKNPVICMPQGSALLFENLTPKNYPIYEKNSLINTNQQFDFSKFLLLAEALQKKAVNVTQFVFTFDQAGVYVFSDANNSAKVTIISIMSQSQQCPSNTVYASLTQANLLKVGISLQKNIVYQPDWGFFLGVIAAFLFIILLSIFVVGYVYRKSWKSKSIKQVEYQKRHYDAVEVEDPEEPDALITINADSQSFYVLNQGKDVVRTRDQLKARRAQDKLDRERKKKEKLDKGRILELEQVEDLKDKLNKHMLEIRKLFGMGSNDQIEDDVNLESQAAHEDDFSNQRLIDQILKLKLLINENRRALEGDNDDDNNTDAVKEKEDLEREEKERRERERKLKEELERVAKDEALEKATEQQAKHQQDRLDEKKDTVIDNLDRDADKKKRDMLARMQRVGGEKLSQEEQDQMMAQLDDNLSKIGEVMQRDEAEQEDMLRRKLEERASRRKKLQEKLKVQEKVIEEKKLILEEKKEEVEIKAQEAVLNMEDELAKEKVQGKEDIEMDLERKKMEKLQSYEDQLRDAKNTKDFSKVLEGYQSASKRVDTELEKERSKQDSDLEKQLKNRRAQKLTQIEKDKNENLKKLQKEYDVETEKERKHIDELSSLLKLEESSTQGGTTGNSAIDKGLEKLRQVTEAQTQDEMELQNSLKQNRMDLKKKIEKGLFSALENKMHRHTIEADTMEREMKKEVKELDDEVEQAKLAAKQQLQTSLSKKEQLQKQMEVSTDEDEKKRLLNELNSIDNDIQAQLSHESSTQDSALQKKLAQRKKRRTDLAEQQLDMKQRQLQEMKFETEVVRKVAYSDSKRSRDRQALDQVLNEMKLTVPKEELPFAIQRALDVKHEAELNDMLAQLFEQKCKELQDEIFNLIEQKMSLQSIILRESKDSLELVVEMENSSDEKLRKQASVMREVAMRKKERALQELELQFKQKEQQLDRDVSERTMASENQKMNWLKEQQLLEKREIFAKHLPQESSLSEAFHEMANDEEKEILEYKREQEIDRQRKMEELDRVEKELLKEVTEQRAKLEQMERENKRMQMEELKKERVQLNRKKREEAKRNSGDFINQLKKDLEKVNEQLDSALSQEKQRQLQLMQQQMLAKLAEAEKLQREEEEKARAEAEAEIKKKEEEERVKKEQEERVLFFKKQIEQGQKPIDKRKYLGGKIEKRTEYFELLMRKKENNNAIKLQRKFGLALQNKQDQASIGLDDAQPAVSKEQQVRLLTDILQKIETLESKVRQQLTKQKASLGNNLNNVLGKNGTQNNLDTVSAYKSQSSFMSKY